MVSEHKYSSQQNQNQTRILNIVKEHKEIYRAYARDQIAHEMGHEVVLPPHHCQYNPIELLWAQENIPRDRERCSITDARYFDLQQQKTIPALQKRKCLQTTVFMQDAAPPHIARPVQALFQPHFREDQISFPHGRYNVFTEFHRQLLIRTDST
ncbi:hypothetical protein AVEN_70563-1 [Araneus ventricosus]|uniref:Tc1-like transposase DDE domain-containing protein n=1 Tax=Araneus ventricosus TaxID=182803 RepID=A0A4Y2TZ67_ARAVE|nr:hypothetical protein AVEN_70563-1 [Araneus ventricosus]